MTTNPLDIVDISEVNTIAAKRVLDAATSQGFLFIKGHSFTDEEVRTVFDLSRDFFDLPFDYKARYVIDKTNHGYTGYGVEMLDPEASKKGDPKEALNIGSIDFVTGKSAKTLPDWFDALPSRRKTVEELSTKLYSITIRLLKLLAIALEVEDEGEVKGCDWFESRYDPAGQSGSTLRFLHYPSVKSQDPDLKIRAGAHTDYGSMTLLFQQPNQEGLEIYSPLTKRWESVPYVSSEEATEGAPIIVNIGDQLSYWTAGLLRSTIHRVRFPDNVQDKGRYSVVFFSHPNDETLLSPVPSPQIRSIKGRGPNLADKLITAREHLNRRLAATYGWGQKQANKQ